MGRGLRERESERASEREKETERERDARYELRPEGVSREIQLGRFREHLALDSARDATEPDNDMDWEQ